MQDVVSVAKWASQEVGRAWLNDVRRTNRAVEILSAVGTTPAGRMTQVFKTSSELEAAGRFIRSDDVAVAALRGSISNAAARRCREQPFVYVPVDQSSLTLTDPHGRACRWKIKQEKEVIDGERRARGSVRTMYVTEEARMYAAIRPTGSRVSAFSSRCRRCSSS